MRGRKPKPTVLKLIAGKPGHRPLPANEPQPVGNLTNPPAWMTDSQKEGWRCAIENAPKGLLRLLDGPLLAKWVCADDEWMRAEIALQTDGPVVKQGGSERTTTNPDGTVVKTVRSDSLVPSPWSVVRDRAFQRMLKATSELGFSPTSRSRISLAGGGAKETNRFANNAAKSRA